MSGDNDMPPRDEDHPTRWCAACGRWIEEPCEHEDPPPQALELAWRKHACSGVVAIVPKEFGGGSAHIVPRAFGSTKARLRLHDNPHARHFFFHQFYANTAAAQAALLAHLAGCHNASAQRQRCEIAP